MNIPVNTPINDKLQELRSKGKRPFHMPGHKRRSGPSPIDQVRKMDITEITGYDNLHHPEGIIRESMDLLKKIYHTKESWYLVGGSTAGILAAISAVCRPGDKILIARNCHRSVYHAIRIRRLTAVYLCPAYHQEYHMMLDIGPGERERIAEILEEEGDIRAVVITSPTYEGVVSDIAAIREVISGYDDRIPLIVDEAHGAHLHFHDAFPRSAVECGADLVVQSTHKTLPALTQTALLHLCSDRVSRLALNSWLSVYETSSPSYILMASAEESVMFMHNSWKKVAIYVDNLLRFRKKCGQLSYIHLIEGGELSAFDYDIGKLLFFVRQKKNGGKWLFDRLRDEWDTELEMAGRTCALAMTSVMDEWKSFAALFAALQSLDDELREVYEGVPDAKSREGRKASVFEDVQEGSKCRSRETAVGACRLPEKRKESWECEGEEWELLPLSESVGRTAADFITLYPPGIPLLVPGEKIIKEMVEKLRFYLYNGYNVQGLSEDRIPVSFDPNII